MFELGFIGFGNMGQAMAEGIISAGIIKAENIQIIDISQDKTKEAAEKMKIAVAQNNKELVLGCKVIILALKPQFYQSIIKEIKEYVKEDTIIVSIAPGQSLGGLLQSFGKPLKIVRTMPNAPAMICQGMSALCKNEYVTDEEILYIKSLFEGVGKAEIVPEYMMNAVLAASGSSPAYVCLFIDALADAAVREGMPRSLALSFIEQAVVGTAKMLQETGMHPSQLKDTVCSPGGTTIEAVSVLEDSGFRSSLIKAAAACVQRACELQ